MCERGDSGISNSKGWLDLQFTQYFNKGIKIFKEVTRRRKRNL